MKIRIFIRTILLTLLLNILSLSNLSANAECDGESHMFEFLIKAADKRGISGKFDKLPPYVRPKNYRTAESTSINGFKFFAHDDQRKLIKPNGVVYLVQGNSSYVDHLFPHATYIARLGYDVILNDYRGYGRSKGMRPEVKMIIDDYVSILMSGLDSETDAFGGKYDKSIAFGISIGGVILLNTGLTSRFDGVILDSVPSSIDFEKGLKIFSNLGFYLKLDCPDSIQPWAKIPDSVDNIIIVQGHKDKKVRAFDESQKVFVESFREKGAVILDFSTFGHPFPDASYRHVSLLDETRQRIRKIFENLSKLY